MPATILTNRPTARGMGCSQRSAGAVRASATAWCWIVVLAASSDAAQRQVLMEKYSATWCPHCMTSSQVVDELMEDHPGAFIPLDLFIATNGGGRYYTSWGIDRGFNFYQVTSYPTVWFNGAAKVTGSAGVYDKYLQAATLEAAKPTDVTVDIAANYLGGRRFEIVTAARIDAGGASKTVRMALVEAVDQLGVFDDLTTRPRNTLKQPLEPGFNVAVQEGQSVEFARTYVADDVSWSRLADVRLIAWAQTPAGNGPAEIHNAFQLVLADAFRGDYNADRRSDGRDFLQWQRDDGFESPRRVWETHFGSPPAAGPAALATPEPGAAAWLLAAAAWASGRRPRPNPSSRRLG